MDTKIVCSEQKMTPVLALVDPVRGQETLRDVFGFEDLGAGRLRYGDLTIAVCDATQIPDDMMHLRMDHLALRVPDIAPMVAQCRAKRAWVTPDGPREIAEFWDFGVRFIFFEGPEGWPIEFCMQLGGAGEGRGGDFGLDHFGIRTLDVVRMADQLASLGAVLIAQHRLGEVDVQFVKRADQMFELFNEAPFARPPASQGWVGFLCDTQPQ